MNPSLSQIKLWDMKVKSRAINSKFKIKYFCLWGGGLLPTQLSIKYSIYVNKTYKVIIQLNKLFQNIQRILDRISCGKEWTQGMIIAWTKFYGFRVEIAIKMVKSVGKNVFHKILKTLK